MLNGTGPATLQRITLVTDESLEALIVDMAQQLGAESYICSYCSGKPLRRALERPMGGSLVRIELLAQSGTAETIMSFIRQLQHRHDLVTAVIDPVSTIS
jgi:hypothetical protein